MDVFVARQPIFNRSRELFAYELLFRSDDIHNEFDGTEDESATTQVIANSLLSIGLENVVGHHKAFINFNENLLRAGLHSMLPRDQIVLEILESVELNEELTELCRNLRGQGYTIALDDFTADPCREPLTHIAHMIKVDIHATDEAEQQRILRTYQPRGIEIIAERVETFEEFEWAKRAGYDHFQGFFFAKPMLMRGRQIPAAKFNCLRLLREMQSTELDFGRLQELISQDVSFSYKLLRYVNSALFSPAMQIDSIGQSLMVLGEEGVRHWVAVAALPELAKDKPGELVTHSLVRASFCDRLAKLAGAPQQSQGFLMGLFSLLDALIDIPLDEALRQVGVSPAISAALLGTAQEQDLLRNVYALACMYERSEWKAVAAGAVQLKIDPAGLGRAYSEATLWAQHALHATTRLGNSRKEPRHPAQGSLRIRWEDAEGRERTLNAQLKNVSKSGLQLQVIDSIPVRTLVSCNEPQLGIAGTGSVRYCNPCRGKYLIGLEFANGTGWPKRSA